MDGILIYIIIGVAGVILGGVITGTILNRALERKRDALLKDAMEKAHHALVEKIVENEDALMESYLAGKEPSLEDLRRVNRPVVHFNADITSRNLELKRFLFQNLYRHYKVDKMRIKAEIFITRLFETYLRYPNLLPPKYRLRLERFGLQRVVCDYIAGMTDRFALDEYKRLFEPYERV